MPQAPAVEKSLLSMMSIDPTNIISRCISDGVNSDYFYIPAHRIIWENFRGRYDKGQTVDATSVAQELEDHGLLEAVGGNKGCEKLNHKNQQSPGVENLITDVDEIEAFFSQ